LDLHGHIALVKVKLPQIANLFGTSAGVTHDTLHFTEESSLHSVRTAMYPVEKLAIASQSHRFAIVPWAVSELSSLSNRGARTRPS
jgi:hypothetical protein